MYREIITFLILFALAMLTGLLPRDSRTKVTVSQILLLTGFVIIGLVASQVIRTDTVLSISPLGIPDLFRVGLVEAYFLMLLAALGVGISFYSVYYFGEYLHHGRSLRLVIPALAIFFLSLVGVIAANEAVTFLILWEIMSFSSFLLVVSNYREDRALLAGTYYLVITHIGMFAIVLSFLPMVLASHSLFFSHWVGVGAGLSPVVQGVVFFAALVGFGSKAGLVPVHVWLPRAHAIAPSNVSAMMSAFMIKIPVLFLFRYVFVYFGGDIPVSWGITVLVVALASSFFGIFHALIQSNFKKLLAYSSIENIGIIFIGFAVAMIGYSLHDGLLVSLGFFASAYHLINHAFFKTLLFLSAGSIMERTGTLQFDRLGGLAKRLPFFAKICLIGSLSIAAIPPLNGFISEFVTYLGLIQGVHLSDHNLSVLFFFAVVILSITSIFAFIVFASFYSITFLGEPREDTVVRDTPSFFERFAFVYFTAFLLVLSLVPGWVLSLVNRLLVTSHIITAPAIRMVSPYEFVVHTIQYNNILVFEVLVVVGLLVYSLNRLLFRRVRTVESWGCGYQTAVPTSQYTAFSMIQPLRKIFSYLYLESKTQKRHDKSGLYAKRNLDFEYQVKDHFILERYIYDPIILLLVRLNHQVKRFQNGDLQLYLLYMFAAILALLSFYLLVL